MKKRSKNEIYQQARDEAENSPVVRQLRELYDRGMADLEARRSPGDPPIVRDIREVYERGMAELEEQAKQQRESL